jgi:predicted GIY-YIG superfamily endonuclease
VAWAFLWLLGCSSLCSGQDPRAAVDHPDLRDIVAKAVAEVHDGWSSDEVILRDDLNQAFLSACRRLSPHTAAVDLNWTLVNLRKARRLKLAVTRRRSDSHEAYRHAAEIAARLLGDQHAVTTDRIMCDPALRAEFDRVARGIAPQADAYLLRKAAFGLRKARQLEPELVVRISDWGREITTDSAANFAAQPQRIPDRPGVYIFRDSTGYLYIGESDNLRARLTKHLQESDRQSLANYLRRNGADAQLQIEIHAFDPDSKARQTRIRRAYESELIESRSPRFNVRP